MKSNIKLVIGIFIGILISAGAVYAAQVFSSDKVTFTPSNEAWKVKNVEEALNSLYSFSESSFVRGDTNAKNIVNKLGTINTSMDEVLSDPFWRKRLVANNNTFDLIFANDTYLDYILNSSDGMDAVGQSRHAIEKLFLEKYSKLVSSSYLSSLNSYAIQVPKMTSNTEPSGEAQASSESLPAYYAFNKASDYSGTRGAWVGSKYSNGYIQYKFDEPNRIYKITLENLFDGGTNYVTSFTLQGSNDGTNFVDLYSGNNGSGNNTKRAFIIPTLQERYQYYRITINGKGGNWPGFGEVEFFCFDV